MFAVRKWETAGEFLAQNQIYLEENESFYNLMLGWSRGIAEGTKVGKDPIFFSILQNGSIIGQALRTHPPMCLMITHLPEAAVEVLIQFLRDDEVNLAGVLGPKATSTAFSTLWIQRTGQKVDRTMNQGVYELTSLEAPPDNGGRAIRAEEKHRPLLIEYVKGFFADCFPTEERSMNEIERDVDVLLGLEWSLFWENGKGKLVSFASSNRESENGATIGYVYTPPSERGHGYGSNVTAAVTKARLETGKRFCNLYTDLDNPTSNSIYRKIGYRQIGESSQFWFSS